MKVWQATWIYPDIPRDDRNDDNINPIFLTKEKAMKFLEEVAATDWEGDGQFPGLTWDEQFDWRRIGTINDADHEDNRYIAQEVEVK